MTDRGRRVVLLGGTFDPIHLGHLTVADQAREALGAEEVWLIPAAVPPHRSGTVASAADRLAMVEAAASGDAHLRVLDLELRRGGPSYTVDTLAELRAAHPDVEQWFVLGADAAREIRTWHGADTLLATAHLLLVNRLGVPELGLAEARSLGFQPTRSRVIHIASPPISATAIRRLAAAGASLEGLVPSAVAALIRDHGLYRGESV